MSIISGLLFIAYISVQRPIDVAYRYEYCIIQTQTELEEMESMNLNSVLTPTGDRAYLTNYDIQLLEHCVMSEAGGESLQCQEAVACVILNRWLNPEKYGDTIYDVIYAPGQFSCSMSNQPTVSVRLAVHDALLDLNTYLAPVPYNCYYFRANHYHENLGIPYCNYDNTYFSLAEDSAL